MGPPRPRAGRLKGHNTTKATGKAGAASAKSHLAENAESLYTSVVPEEAPRLLGDSGKKPEVKWSLLFPFSESGYKAPLFLPAHWALKGKTSGFSTNNPMVLGRSQQGPTNADKEAPSGIMNMGSGSPRKCFQIFFEK